MTRRFTKKGVAAAIPCKYKGIQFRSRLEAKWASFLEHLGKGWRWEYEPDLQLGRVIPDFLLVEAKYPTLLECKPATSIVELSEYRADLAAGRLAPWLESSRIQRALIVVGPTLYPAEGRITLDGNYGFALCTFRDEGKNHVGLAAQMDDPCLLCNRKVTAWMPEKIIQQAWVEAGNSVQWRPPSDPEFVKIMSRGAKRRSS